MREKGKLRERNQGVQLRLIYETLWGVCFNLYMYILENKTIEKYICIAYIFNYPM
jgi:hypothetical protein